MEGQTSQYMFSLIQITPGFSCRLWVVIKSHSNQHTIVTASRSIPQVLHQYCLMLLKSNHFRKWNVPGMIVEARCAAILRKGPASGWWSKKRNLFYICSFVCIWWWLIHPHHSPNIFNLRGERCKFKHPADKKEGDEKIPFCNDFRQVKTCIIIVHIIVPNRKRLIGLELINWYLIRAHASTESASMCTHLTF